MGFIIQFHHEEDEVQGVLLFPEKCSWEILFWAFVVGKWFSCCQNTIDCWNHNCRFVVRVKEFILLSAYIGMTMRTELKLTNITVMQ